MLANYSGASGSPTHSWRAVVIDAIGNHGNTLVRVRWIGMPADGESMFIRADRFRWFPDGEEIRWALEGKG